MSKVRADISVSLDGYVAGPNQTMEEPLGENGERAGQDVPILGRDDHVLDRPDLGRRQSGR